MLLDPSVRPARRRGAIAPLTAVLALFILGMVAFAVDTSWIVLTQSELQNAADAAALAASNRLMDGFVLYNGPNQTSSEQTAIVTASTATASATAKTYAAVNGAGGVKSLALLADDVEYGVVGAAGTYTPLAKAGGFPNTVRVTLRRDASANTPLRLFFAPVVGMTTLNLTATASATVYAGRVDSFKSTTGISTGALPLTYDVNAWSNFLKTGKDPDGKATTDSGGNPLLQVYPCNKDTGNFGLLGLDDSHAGASDMRNWIQNGMSSAEIDTLLSNKLVPLSARDGTQWDWLGNTGFKSSNVADVNAYVGKTFLLPLFKPYDPTSGNKYTAGVGTGSQYNYNIVEFVGVRIVDNGDTGRQVVVRPAAVLDPNAVFLAGSVVPAGSTTESNTLTTFAPPKLTN